jgi:hypothetical membrane protein
MFILASIESTVFFCLTFLSHVCNRDLRFKKDALSKYALGQHGWMMSLGLYAIGLAEISLARALAEAFDPSLGTTLLAIAGVGAILVAMFKMEYPKETFRGYVHALEPGFSL